MWERDGFSRTTPGWGIEHRTSGKKKNGKK
jgi:hypothetical protein